MNDQDAKSFANAVSNGDTNAALALEKNLKKTLLSNPYFPPTCLVKSNDTSAINDMVIARSILESSTLLSLQQNDMASFEKHVTQLIVYYTDYRHILPISDVCNDVLGMHLLHLLVEHRMAEFHSTLELLPSSESREVQYVLSLETGMMEGSFGKVLCTDVPSSHWKPLVTMLQTTVRQQIARCIVSSNTSLSRQDARDLLYVRTDDELNDIVKQDDASSWVCKDNVFCFTKPTTALRACDIPSIRLVTETLTVATELDRIV